MRRCLQMLYAGLGVLCLLLGLLGIVVPILPTTPLIILAAFLFSRSNERLHAWLLRQPLLGPAILDWRHHRSISSKAKFAATLLIGSSLIFTLCVAPLPLWVLSLIVAIALGALSFVLTRPTTPRPLPSDAPTVCPSR